MPQHTKTGKPAQTPQPWWRSHSPLQQHGLIYIHMIECVGKPSKALDEAKDEELAQKIRN